MRDPKPSPRPKEFADTARDVAGDTAAASAQAGEAGADAALGDDISPENARGIASTDTEQGASNGEAEREDAVDAHDVAGDTRGASR